MAQWVKELALSLLWRGFDPWSKNFCMLLAQPRKKKKEKGNRVNYLALQCVSKVILYDKD